MITISAAQNVDLQGVLDLQAQNLSTSISEEERLKQGFLTVEHTLELLQAMNTPYPHIVAKEKDQVVGFCLTMLEGLRHTIPVIEPMFEKIDLIMESDAVWTGKSYFAMGQVCVAKSHRGQGLFYQLYDGMKDQMAPHFDLIITEISDYNKRSMRAHEKQGFKIMHSYTAPDGHPWHIVYWDWR